MEEQSGTNEYRQQRLENLEKLIEMGYEPWGRAFERTGTLGVVRDSFEEEKTVRIAGRLVAKREMGKSIFAHLQDATGRFQVYAKKSDLGEEAFTAFKTLDLGDYIGAEGALFTTRTGEATLGIAQWELLSKALLPLPEKWHGLQDVDTRYRQRYLDLIANEEVRDLFRKRTESIRTIRAFLNERGFQEVETPMMQPMAGGAAASPFKTRYQALNTDMYLRIAPELYLKRLLVGGFDKVFELNRNFRNEGLSRSHNPEFTMLEIYEAFGDMRTMKKLVENLVTHVAETVFGTLKVGTEGEPVDLSTPWREATYHELVKERAGEDWFDLSLDEKCAKAESLGAEIAPDWNETEVTQEVFEKLIEKTLMNPTFVTRLPVELVPLAKACPDDSSLVDVFELIIGGREIAPAYTELNDPIEQRKRFEEQAGLRGGEAATASEPGGDGSAIDHDFLTALEHGMPPAGGMGIGIDRLIMVLTGAEAIRDVILFPQLKPRA